MNTNITFVLFLSCLPIQFYASKPTYALMPPSLKQAIKDGNEQRIILHLETYPHDILTVDEKGNSMFMQAIIEKKGMLIPIITRIAVKQKKFCDLYTIHNNKQETIQSLLKTHDNEAQASWAIIAHRLSNLYAIQQHK